MIKSKKLISAAVLSAMVLTGTGVGIKSIDNVTIVEAASKVNSATVNNKVSQLEKSIRSNYLGLKNVGQWQAYIKDARNLNSKLSNGSTKNSYAGRINKAEQVVTAAARVNQLEISMAKNAHTQKNVAQWEKYGELALNDLKKIDPNLYARQYNELLARLLEKGAEISSITGEESDDLIAIVEKYNTSNVKIIFGEKIKSSEKDVKDSIVVKVNGKQVGIKSATISKNGVVVNVLLQSPVKAGQTVVFSLKEDGSIEDLKENIIYTDGDIEVINNL